MKPEDFKLKIDFAKTFPGLADSAIPLVVTTITAMTHQKMLQVGSVAYYNRRISKTTEMFIKGFVAALIHTEYGVE